MSRHGSFLQLRTVGPGTQHLKNLKLAEKNVWIQQFEHMLQCHFKMDNYLQYVCLKNAVTHACTHTSAHLLSLPSYIYISEIHTHTYIYSNYFSFIYSIHTYIYISIISVLYTAEVHYYRSSQCSGKCNEYSLQATNIWKWKHWPQNQPANNFYFMLPIILQ